MQLVHFMIIISCSPGTENAEVRRSFNAAALPISPAENKLLSCFKLNTLVNQILPKHLNFFNASIIVVRKGQEGRSHPPRQERPGPEDWQDQFDMLFMMNFCIYYGI